MKFGMIAAGTLSRAMERKHVAALSHYQTEYRDAPSSFDTDGTSAR
jgi:hypothetical protein